MANLRFHTNSPLVIGSSVQLSDNAAAHATKALRLNVGDNAILFNGNGLDYDCELTSVKKNTVIAKINASKHVSNESPLRITLLQAISSGDRMDYTIQKAVELGVTSILPISSQRSLVKLSAERAEKRLEHWRNVVISACEQSGRSIVPSVYTPLSFSHLFSHINKVSEKDVCKIMLAPDATDRLCKIANPSNNIYLLIGAEGGFTEDEVTLSKVHGFQPVQLGARILRTETAALAAISAMQTLWGDF